MRKLRFWETRRCTHFHTVASGIPTLDPGFRILKTTRMAVRHSVTDQSNLNSSHQQPSVNKRHVCVELSSGGDMSEILDGEKVLAWLERETGLGHILKIHRRNPLSYS